MPDLESVPWIWALPEDAERFAVLPQAQPETVLDAETAYHALLEAANAQTELVLVLGWCPRAHALMAADSVLSRKTLVWLVPLGQLAHLAAAEQTRTTSRGELLVAGYDDADRLAGLIDQLPLVCWSAIVLIPGESERLTHLRRQRLYAASHPAERTLNDLAHLLAREERIATGTPLSAWAARWRGRAALCVAAGPSLDRDMEFVRANQDRCLVIACDIVHARLRAAGITVDVVVNVDSHELIRERIGQAVDDATLLVMPLNGHRDLDLAFPKRAYAGGDALSDLLLGPGSGYNTGTNVGCATVGLAAFFGCSELILVGHDLCFADGRYYSGLVEAGGTLGSRALLLSQQQLVEVEGNHGGMVQTNANFKVGIRDLGMLIERLANHGMRVFNSNITHGSGARVPFTEAVPLGWVPPGEGPCPRLSAPAPLGDRLPAGGIAAAVTASLQAWRSAWLASSPGTLERFTAGSGDPLCTIARQLATPFIMAPLCEAFRLQAQPAGVSVVAHLDRLAQATEGLAMLAIERIAAVVSARASVLPEQPTWWNQAQLQFFANLRGQLPKLPEATLDEVLIPLIARDVRGISDVAPNAPLFPPHSFFDGLHICSYLGMRTPVWYVRETLAHCLLARSIGMGEAVDLAVASGVLSSSDVDPCNGSGDDPLAAARAVIRLRDGLSGDLAVDARIAVTWQPTQVPLVRALLQDRRNGPAVLAEIMSRLRVDDRLAETILRDHPDTPTALELLAPHESVLGEGATIAIAEKHLALGQPAAALSHAERIRPLSNRVREALALVFDGIAEIAGVDAVAERFAQIPSRTVAIRVFHGFLVRRLGQVAAATALPGCNVDPVPAEVLSAILAGLMTSGSHDAASTGAVAELAERALSCGPEVAERIALEEVAGLARRAQRLSAVG